MKSLGWLPMKQQIEFEIMKLAHKSIYQENFPSYLKGFKLQIANGQSRSQQDSDFKFDTRISEKLFIGKGSRLFNEIPKVIREEVNHKKFCGLLKNYLLDNSLAIYYPNND